MATATFLDNSYKTVCVSETNTFKSEFCSQLPFRVKFMTIGIGGSQNNMVAPIGIAIIGFNNYIL